MCPIASDLLLPHPSSSLPPFSPNTTLPSPAPPSFRTPDFPSSSFLPRTISSRGFGSHTRLHAAASRACGHVDVPPGKSAFGLTSELPPMLMDHRDDVDDDEGDAKSPDRWMEESVCDIVRSINEAPFLHMLFDTKDARAPSSTMCERHRIPINEGIGAEDEWIYVKDRVNRASPDGVILVHPLDDESLQDCKLGDGAGSECRNREEGCSSGGSTGFWGILVLGKSIARSACYILKTTSVTSSLGTCTGFCLSKAKCFGPSWHDQMQNSWLLGAEKSSR